MTNKKATVAGEALQQKTNRSDVKAESATVNAIIYRPISSLKLDPRNPRMHCDRQVRQIASSIKVFGFNVPILVDASLKVIAGHGRILACQRLGWTEVPTIRIEHLSEAQAQAFRIADNRLSETSVWDDQLLAEQLKELSLLDLDFDLEVTGFETGEIDFRIESLSAEKSSEGDPADVLPVDVAGLPVSRLGDLWLLDRHRVYCGSALAPAAYTAVMEREKAAMVFTDPPYNLRIESNVSGLGKVRHRDFTMAVGELSAAEFTVFLTKAFTALARHSVAGSLHFQCIDWRHMGEMLAAGAAVYTELKNVCVWAKDRAGMGSLYRSQHELVFVFKSGRASHRNNVLLGQYGRNRTNVWSYPSAASFSKSSDEGNLLAVHPTVKPVALVADAIVDVSARGDTVLDAFLGSGTTVIAAERTGRRCYGLEIDPLYVDTIVRRWQAFTRQRAVRAADERYFDELEEEVEGSNAD